MSTLDLPPELWQEIAQYFSPPVLQHVRGVNRILFDLAMDARYRDVRIEELDEYAVHVLDALQHVGNARRVRRLSICPHLFEEHASSKVKSANGPMGFAIFNVVRNRFKEHNEPGAAISASEAKQKFAAIVPSMTGLTHFTVDWTSFDDVPAPCIDLVWKLHGPRLTHVGITATTVKLRSMFLLPTALVHVRDLKVAIRKRPSVLHQEPEMMHAQAALSSFVNSLSGTLEQLEVSCTPAHDVSFFYSNLGRFDRLATLNLNVSAPSHPEAQTYKATAFVQHMGPRIRSLTLSASSTVSPFDSYQFTFADLELENLHSLTVSADVMAVSWENTLGFLKRHSSSLRSLTIDGPIALEELSKLLTVVNHRAGNSAIASLSIAVYQVNAEFFATLASELCRLESLCLRIRMLTSATARSITPSQFFPQDVGGENEYPFVQEMKAHSFSDWKLNDITIMRRSCCGEIVLWGLLMLCAGCIPSIRSFNGNKHAHVPDPPNEKPGRFDKRRSCSSRIACNYGLDGIDSWQNAIGPQRSST